MQGIGHSNNIIVLFCIWGYLEKYHTYQINKLSGIMIIVIMIMIKG